MDPLKTTECIRRIGLEEGFSYVGFSKAERLDEAAINLEKWLSQGMHGSMSYMANHFEKRVDPRQLVHGAKSVITFLYNYHTDDKQADPSAPKISKYAYGRDYHKVVKKKLKTVFTKITEEIGAVEGRYFVDSAPVMEREWAQKSGTGWLGKNTLLISPKSGSYFFLGEIISDLEIVADGPIKDFCGTCTKCIDACPTDAISPKGYLLDASKCISYLTIELKESLPDEFQGKMENWMFGCDICQEVCPWNSFATTHEEEQFLPRAELLSKTKEEWINLSELEFDNLFDGSPVKRTKYAGLKRNIKFLSKD